MVNVGYLWYITQVLKHIQDRKFLSQSELVAQTSIEGNL
jgi:hypothetical protein